MTLKIAKFLNGAHAFCLTRSAATKYFFGQLFKRDLKRGIPHDDKLSVNVKRSTEREFTFLQFFI